MNSWLTVFIVCQSVVPNWTELLLCLVKSAAVVALLAIVATALRNGSARSRSWVWRAALVSLAALSVWKFGPHALSSYHPAWRVLPDYREISAIVPASSAKRLTMPAYKMPYLMLLGLLRMLDAYVPLLWKGGIGICLAWSAMRTGLGRWWLRSSRPATEFVQKIAQDVSAKLETAVPTVAICEGLTTPLLIGYLRPSIFLPAACLDWTAEKLEAAFLHEMAHWRRGDLPWQMAALIVTAFWWWNPLAWLAAKKLRLEAEQAADDVVLLNRHENTAYAQMLVEIAASVSDNRFSAGIAMARHNSLETRIRQLLRTNPGRGKLSRTGVAVALCLTCATLWLGGFYLTFGVGRGAVDTDPVSRTLRDAESLTSEGKYEDALQKFLRYWQASKVESTGQGGVRVSFALVAWMELGQKYPKAMSALLAIRDDNEKKILTGNGDFQIFQEYTSINGYLHHPERTFATYQTVRARDPKQADGYFYIMQDMLVAHHQYSICSKSIPDAEAALGNLVSDRKTEIQVSEDSGYAEHKAFFLKSADQRFEKSVRQLIEILVGSQRMADAEAVQKRALKTLNTPAIRRAITDAKTTVQQAHS
jgi:beta-lactamase regulating signal transducer with metallopeptidase domain